jgi:hypothetical protein
MLDLIEKRRDQRHIRLLDGSNLNSFKDQSYPVVELLVFQTSERLTKCKITNDIKCSKVTFQSQY